MQDWVKNVGQLLNNPSPHTETEDLPASATAAVAGEQKSTTVHTGKRHVKEIFTNHWDLDYLPRSETDNLFKSDE
ncbi:hypothetical protein JCM14076_09800 [Methylosoma difficile]